MKPHVSSPVKLGAALLIAVAVGGLSILNSFNHFDRVRPSFAGSCMPVAGVPGPEDLQIDEISRRAFISSFDRRGEAGEGARGAILAVSIDDPLAGDAWRDRTNGQPVRFEPLGLHYYSEGSTRRLFVTNAAAPSVEMYDVDDNGDLAHLETFSERRLTSPVDVVAVGPSAFYVTNDESAERSGFLNRLQFLTRANTGKVLYYDGRAWILAAENLRYANGVNASNDQRRIYVAETAGAAIKVYDRNHASGVLRLSETIPMHAAVYNINVDRTGALWIGAHPKPLVLPSHSRDPEMTAPSMVIRYDDAAGVVSRPVEVFVDDGAQISASTTAAKLGSKLIIGALLEKKFLICDLEN